MQSVMVSQRHLCSRKNTPNLRQLRSVREEKFRRRSSLCSRILLRPQNALEERQEGVLLGIRPGVSNMEGIEKQ